MLGKFPRHIEDHKVRTTVNSSLEFTTCTTAATIDIGVTKEYGHANYANIEERLACWQKSFAYDEVWSVGVKARNSEASALVMPRVQSWMKSD